MKTFKVKNYKGNLVESLSRFQKSHKGMKIVEACEDGDDLKIKAEKSKKINEANRPWTYKFMIGKRDDSDNVIDCGTAKIRTIDDLRRVLEKNHMRNGVANIEMELFDPNSNTGANGDGYIIINYA